MAKIKRNSNGKTTVQKLKQQCKQKSRKKVNCAKKKRVERNYSLDSMKEALTALREEGKTLREVANSFGIPKSTLFRKLKNGDSILNKKGAPTVLTDQEEEYIVKWVLYCTEKGFPVTKKQLLDTVKKFLIDSKRENPFKDNCPGYKWYCLFMKRHSNLSIHTAQNLTSTRASISEQDLRQWFSKLKNYLEEKDLLNIDPKRVFNLDESSFMLVPPNSCNEKESLTILFTAAASGELLPPMILFDLKTIPRKEGLEKIPKDWAIGNTEKGWMVAESFYKYIVNVFYKWLVENNYEFPVILYANNHSSHLTMPLAKFCQEKQIELIGLYPHATHLIQPLDVGLFHVLKEKYKEANNLWRIENNVIDVKKYMFAEILKKALDSYDFKKYIINGFKVCGLIPFNPDKVQYNILNKKKRNSKQDSTTNGDEIATLNNSISGDTFLEKFEKDLLSPSTLEEFRIAEFSKPWTGDIRFEGLFECWKKLRNTSGK